MPSRRSGALILAVLSLLPAARSSARPWQGVEAGVSTRAEVISHFGDPSKTVARDGKEILAYTGKNAAPGTLQTQFRIDSKTQLLERIDAFPRAVIDRETVINTFGTACVPGQARQAACFVQKLSEDAKVHLLYARLGLAVFLRENGVTVASFVFLPERKDGPPAPTSLPMPPPPVPGKKPSATAATTPQPPAPDAPIADSAPPATGEGGGEDGWAVDTAFAPVNNGSPVEKAYELGGEVRVQSFTQVTREQADKLTGRADVTFSLRAKARLGNARLFGSLLARKDFMDPARDRIDSDEAYVALDSTHVRGSAGRMLLAWGTANLFNPTDLLNPVDRRDLLVPEKRGAWMARVELLAGPVKLEALYLPVFEPHAIPLPEAVTPDGVLISRSPWISGSVAQPSPIPLTYRMGQVRLPPLTVSNGQGAARLSAALFGVDLSLGYAFLYDRLPISRPVLALAEPIPVSGEVTLDLAYQRLHAVTFDFERTFGKLRVAGEALATKVVQPQPGDGEDLTLTYVIGADYVTPELGPGKTFHLFAELTETRALQGALADDFLGRLRHPFRRNVLARVSFQWSTDWQLEVTAVAALGSRADVLIRPAGELRLFDAVTARLGASLLLGDPETFFGQYREHSRVEASLSATF